MSSITNNLGFVSSNLQKNSKFSTFISETKYSVYKYEKNIFNNHTTNQNSDDYITQIKRQSSGNRNVQNLQDLWNMISVDDDKKQFKIQQNTCQLTQEELMQCFGHEQTQVVKETIQTNLLQNDQELMDIWDTEQEQTKKQPSLLDHNRILKDNLNSLNMIVQNKNIINIKTQKLHYHQAYDQLDELEVQDPNKIRYAPKNQVQKAVGEDIKQNKDINKQNYMIGQIQAQNSFKDLTKLVFGPQFPHSSTLPFILQPYPLNTYTYFGLRQRVMPQISSTSISFLSSVPQNLRVKRIFSLYSIQTEQQFLQLIPEKLSASYIGELAVMKTTTGINKQVITKKFMEYNSHFCYKVYVNIANIITSKKQHVKSTDPQHAKITHQQDNHIERMHIGTVFFKNIKDGTLYDLRMWDQQTKKHSTSVALIQVKDGFINDCCYCDTNVFLQKNQNLTQTCIQKLQMILNNKNGKLSVNMGINGIQSSPYNCCLENTTNEKFIYLLGLLKGEEQIQREFIVKVGEGVSPLIGFIISSTRKLYIDSFQ